MLAGAPVFTGLKPAQIRAESALPEQHRNWALFKLTSLRKRAQTQGQAMAYSASMEKCTVEKWMENRLNTNPMGFGSCAGYWEPRGDGQHSAKGWLIISTKSFPVVFIFHIKQESRQAKKKGWKLECSHFLGQGTINAPKNDTCRGKLQYTSNQGKQSQIYILKESHEFLQQGIIFFTLYSCQVLFPAHLNLTVF